MAVNHRPAGRRGLLRALRAALDGNVAVIFTIALIPIMAAIAAAIDYSRAASARTAMQAALDSTALMMSKDAVGLSAAEIQTKAESYFNAMFNRSDVSGVTIATSYSSPKPGSFALNLLGTASVETMVAGVIGISHIDIAATSQVVWGIKRLELALVLDVTGSMAFQNRMVELKKATKSLLATLQAAAGLPDDVKSSIVPFAANVNIGTGSLTATWLDWTDWEAEPDFVKPGNWSSIGPGASCPFSTVMHGFRCTSGPANGSPNTSSIPSSGSYRGFICPSVDSGGENPLMIGRYYNGCYDSMPTTTTSTKTICSGWSCNCGTLSHCSCIGFGGSKVCTQSTTTSGPPYTHNWIKNARSTWNGCVWDRSKDNDASDTTPGAADATRFQPYQSSYCPPAMLPLTSDWTALNAKVDDLDSSGATNITIGLAWGWHALTADAPLTQAATPQPDLDKVIILMTDGDNTLNRWNGTGYVHCAECDLRTTLACSNVKAANIKLYTVRMIEGNATLLRNCATNPDMFYDVSDAAQLNAVFTMIAKNLANLRITR
jgi:Flp pilus assembly protein TadG